MHQGFAEQSQNNNIQLRSTGSMGMHGNIYGNDSMFAFVARQPILDRDKELYAYELLFRDGQNGCLPEYDAEKAQYIANKCLRLGLDEISCDKTSFVNINRETLLHRFPSNLDPKTVVVEIAGNTQVNQGLLDACKHIRMLGYQLAINAPRLEGELTQLLPLIDIVKVDINKISYADITQNIPALLGANVKLVADQVETQQDFGICRDLGFDFFQGYFFSRPADINNKPLPATKATLVELIKRAPAANSISITLTSLSSEMQHCPICCCALSIIQPSTSVTRSVHYVML